MSKKNLLKLLLNEWITSGKQLETGISLLYEMELFQFSDYFIHLFILQIRIEYLLWAEHQRYSTNQVSKRLCPYQTYNLGKNIDT